MRRIELASGCGLQTLHLHIGLLHQFSGHMLIVFQRVLYQQQGGGDFQSDAVKPLGRQDGGSGACNLR